MKTTNLTLAILSLAAVLLASCASHEGAYAPVNKAGANLEDQARFVLLDKRTQDSVACSSLQERRLADGRLEVVANLRNRLNRRIEVQVNCVFKNQSGFATEDESPFQVLILTENAQESVKFVSLNDQPKAYTIRVRQSR